METKQLFAAVLVMSIVVVGISGAYLFMNPPVDLYSNPTDTDTTDTTTTDTGDDDSPPWFFRDQDLLPYNTTIPNWEFDMVDSDNITMESLRGKFVVLIFAATWCPACEYQNTDNVRMYENFTREELEFVQVTTAKGDSDQMLRDYIEDHGLLWDIGKADDAVTAADDFLKIRYIPTLVLIDQDGILRWIHEGTWRFAEWYETMTTLMG